MSEPIVTTKYSIDRSDYANMIWKRRLGRSLLVTGSLYFVIGLILFFTNGPIVAALVWAGFAVFLVGVVFLRGYYIRRRILSAPYENAYVARTYEFDDEAIKFTDTSGVVSLYPWAKIFAAERFGRYLLLFVNPLVHMIVRTDTFQTERDRQNFEELLARKIQVRPISFY